MVARPGPARHRVVIAGGGIAGLEALIAVRLQAPEQTLVTLVAPGDTFAYRALGVEEPFGRGSGRRFSLSAIARDLGAVHLRDGLASVHPNARTVTLQRGAQIPYDSLVVAVGAHPYPAFGHGITFDRAEDPASFDELLDDIDAQLVRDVAIVVPEHVGWTLPAYELALSIGSYGSRPHGRRIGVTLVTHEPRPLHAFGTAACEAVDAILSEAGAEVVCGREALVMSDGALIAGAGWITAERIVALPRLAGPRIAGLPCDLQGFLLVDEHGVVPGVEGVYAAGDGTARPIKQGGLAAQQADAVAEHILWRLGSAPEPEPPAPVLRGILRTPNGPLYLQAEVAAADESSVASHQPLWPAPGRVASRWLTHYLGTGAPAGATT